MEHSLLKNALFNVGSKEEFTKESGVYETNKDLELNINSEEDKNEIISDFKEGGVISEVLAINASESIKDMVEELDDVINGNIETSEILEEVSSNIKKAENELKEESKISNETALSLINSYNTLNEKLGKNVEAINIESGVKYQSVTLELAKESAIGFIKTIKDNLIKLIKFIVEKVKKYAITAIGIVDNIEMVAKDFKQLVDNNYTDVLIKRYEDHIPKADVYGRLAIIPKFNVDEINKFLLFTNKGIDLNGLVDNYVKAIKDDDNNILESLKFKNIHPLGDKYAKLLMSNPRLKPHLSEFHTVFPVKISGKHVVVIGSKETSTTLNGINKIEYKMTLKDFPIFPSEGLVNDMNNPKTVLSRGDISSISQTLIDIGKAQRDNIKTSLAYLDKLKAGVNILNEDFKIHKDINRITNILTKVIYTNAFGGIISNRLILGTLGSYIKLYEKQKNKN